MGGRDVYRCLETGDNAGDTPRLLPLMIFTSAPSHFYWHKSLYKGTGSIIYPLSPWSPPRSTPDAVHLPVSARRQPILTWGVQVSGHASADRVPNDMSRTFQDHERKTSPGNIWSALTQPRWYLRVAACTSRPVRACAHMAIINQRCKYGFFYSLMPVIRDPPYEGV